MTGRILIADDTEVMRSLIRIALQSAGFEIAGEAASGEETIALYRATRPDLVTLDLALEGLDGLGCLAAIRDEDPGARFVVVSAAGNESRIKQAVALGVSDFVVKPFEPERLIAAVTGALAAR